MPSSVRKISAATVRADFNDLTAVVHYAKAAHDLGLWASERLLIERTFTDLNAPLLELGCGAGRVAIALWTLGYRSIVALDFAQELVDQAEALKAERDAVGVTFLHGDATQLPDDLPVPGRPVGARTRRKAAAAIGPAGFAGVLFMFNGLMQIPGRDQRRKALAEAARVSRPGAPLLFTTHDRDDGETERALWRLEAIRWERSEQDPRLVEFGDRYFEDEAGRTFMHLPTRTEILEDLRATGWVHEFDALRRQLAKESKAVRDFSDECRFWIAYRSAESA